MVHIIRLFTYIVIFLTEKLIFILTLDYGVKKKTKKVASEDHIKNGSGSNSSTINSGPSRWKNCG